MNARRRLPAALWAAICFVPLALTAPGVVAADTKSYLYIDPSRLLARATSLWDPNQGLGTVTHQTIGYLWPMGPFFWVFDRVGVPDWLAQRLWLGSILFLAGLGVVFLLRTLEWSGAQVWVAAVVYGLSPYVLTLAARISALLLPFAALPWMIALTVRATRRGGWRDPALLAIVIATAGSVNATALLLAGLGPALWVAYALAVRDVKPREALEAVGRIAVLALPVSAWWIAGLWVQGGYGIEILRYTETAEVVAAASVSFEVMRGLGYWFFYGGDRLGPWIEPSVSFTQRLPLLAISYGLPTGALIGAAISRWRHKVFFVALVGLGTAIAVGAYPWDAPSLWGRGVKAFVQSDTGLAMRSLPRAVPLVALGLAVLTGAGLVAVSRRLPRLARPAAVAVAAVAVLNLPTLWTGRMVPENLRRDEALPSYWDDAAEWIDSRPSAPGTRVLEVPGSDFASYRWGNTVDPITPGLVDRPYVARELIPYGSPPSADLLIALDRRFQEEVVEPEAIAPVARIMGVGDVVARLDLQYERYRTPRPVVLWQDLLAAPGLRAPRSFGAPTPNDPVPEAPLDDEGLLQLPTDWPDAPPVAVFGVTGAVPVVSAVAAGSPLVVAGDGEGIVDAAAAGLIDGDELIFYAAALPDDGVPGDAAVLVTDTNRQRGRRWSTVRHNTGYTEEAAGGPTADDPSDNRLPIFPDAGIESFTVAEHRGGVHATATSYGNAITFTPEERPANAVDGDPVTAWRTGAFGPVTGEALSLTYDQPVTAEHAVLLQQVSGEINRHITRVRLSFDGPDGESSVDVDLGVDSRQLPGERVAFPRRTFDRLTITVLADTGGERPRYGGLTSIGFAEVQVGDEPLVLDEVVVLPNDMLSSDTGQAPLTLLVTRLRSAPSEPTRSDEELSLVRSFTLALPRGFTVSGDARLSAWATDEVIDRLLGITSGGGSSFASSPRLNGDRSARAASTVDGDPGTAWTGRFGTQEGQWLEYRSPVPLPAPAGPASLTVLADGYHSVLTALRVIADDRVVGSVVVPPVDDGQARGDTATVPITLPQAIAGATRVRLEVESVRPVETISWYRNDLVTMPVGIAELTGLGVTAPALAPDAAFDTGCRDDLLLIDGRPVPVRVAGTVGEALAGRPLDLHTCGGPLDVALTGGEHLLRATRGRDSGIDIDRLVLRSDPGGGPSAATGPLVPGRSGGGAVTLRVVDDGRASVTAEVTGATPGAPVWLVMGQSHNAGWRAEVDGDSLGGPALVNGYANGWLVEARASSFTVSFRFTPQRVVTVAEWLSLLAAAVCLVLVVRGGRAPARVRVRDQEPEAAGRVYEGAPPRRAVVVATVAAVAVGTAVVVGPVPALVAAGATLAGLLRARWRPLLAAGAPLLLGLCALYVLAWQVRHDIPPGFEWPGDVARVHQLGWLAVVFLGADVVVDRLWARAARHL